MGCQFGRSSSGRNLIHFNPNEVSLISIKKSRIARMESKAVPCNEGLANKRLWLIAGRYYVERDRHKARKAKFLRGRWGKINDPTFAEWSAIVNPNHDCSTVLQIGDADDCPEG